MYLGGNRVAGAVDEVISVFRLLDVRAHRLIYFPSRDRLGGSKRILHRLYTYIARLTHNPENFALSVRRSLAHKSHPRDVVENRARSILLRPHVQQNKIAFA